MHSQLLKAKILELKVKIKPTQKKKIHRAWLAVVNSANYSWLKGTKFNWLNVFGPISTNYRIATNISAARILQ